MLGAVSTTSRRDGRQSLSFSWSPACSGHRRRLSHLAFESAAEYAGSPSSPRWTTARVIIDVQSDGDAEELAQRIANQVRSSAYDDWGPDAWGGYDGPVLRGFAVRVESAC